MITKWVLEFIGALMGFVLGLMPQVSLPSWFQAAATTLDDALTTIGGYGQWMPLGAIGNGIAFVLLCFGIAFGVRVFRMVLSLFTGGGGGAA